MSALIARIGLAVSVALSATAAVLPGGVALAAEPMSFELLTIAGPAPCAKRRCSNAEIKADVISAQGEITNDTAASFLSFVQAHGGDPDFRPLVLLSSPGGTVVGAMKLGLVLRQVGATVLVARARAVDGSDDLHVMSSSCMSACVYAFFGGKRRIIPPSSHLGIHQMAIYSHSFFGLGDDTVRSKGTPELVSALSAYTKMMGVNPEAIAEAEQVDPTSIHILTPKEIARWRVGTPRLH
ncbi:hypothetical protein [Lichenibacterium dinghuense]|uniref:COG3904 family protein n=1 Tax=Lichenibacterium dinghuense TaxID=2895977 RepID=UPI001F40CE24|nr:hypothetical protein [Lichenibacterium sp. 6Y81]